MQSPIEVSVQPEFLADQSNPREGRYVFAYTVTIENHGDHNLQLLTRYWRITNGQGVITEVEGEGVVGEQPIIEPGHAYQYTSGTVVETPWATMEGHYGMIDEGGEAFETPIPLFGLITPGSVH